MTKFLLFQFTPIRFYVLHITIHIIFQFQFQFLHSRFFTQKFDDCACHTWLRNGKAMFLGTIGSTSSQCNIHFDQEKKLSLWGQFCIRQLWSINVKPLFPNNVIACLSSTSELVRHIFWATFIMHELSGIWTSNYDSFYWKQSLF